MYQEISNVLDSSLLMIYINAYVCIIYIYIYIYSIYIYIYSTLTCLNTSGPYKTLHFQIKVILLLTYLFANWNRQLAWIILAGQTTLLAHAVFVLEAVLYTPQRAVVDDDMMNLFRVHRIHLIKFKRGFQFEQQRAHHEWLIL